MSARQVLVTGASRGLGRAVAEAVAASGAAVIAVARDAELLDDLVTCLPGTGHRAAALDVRDEAAWHRLSSDLDRLDGLVAAAGVYGPIGRIDSIDLDELRATFEINVIGALLAVRACLPRLQDTGGSVVFFAGGGAEALPGYDAYVGSKAAVVRLAENLAAELAPAGVRVNAVAPGFVATDIHRATVAAGPEVAGAEHHARTVKLLQEGGFPASEAAELVSWLVSADSQPVTGRLVSARWDDWREPGWAERFAGQRDLLTMRRVDGELFAQVAR